jgi:ABC-type sugar transport system permease subunit
MEDLDLDKLNAKLDKFFDYMSKPSPFWPGILFTILGFLISFCITLPIGLYIAYLLRK